MFDCRGCEPVRAISVGPVRIQTHSGEIIDVDALDLEDGWYGSCGDGSLEVSVEEVGFLPVRRRAQQASEKEIRSKRTLRRERRRDSVHAQMAREVQPIGALHHECKPFRRLAKVDK